MVDFYERKFKPSIKHIIAYILILLSAVLFISGYHRAMHVIGRLSMQGLTFEPEVYEGDSILLSSQPIKAKLKGTENETVVCWKTILTGILTEYDCFIDYIAEEYRPVMVKKGTKEYDMYLNGEEVTGYFTEKYFDDFPDDILNVISNYETEREITAKNCSTLGIVIVNRQKELISFVWGIPFLIAGIVLLKISGTPFVYNKKTEAEE